MPWFRWLVAISDSYDALVDGQWPACKARETLAEKYPFFRGIRSGARLEAAMAPAFTMGFVVPSSERSMARTELKEQARAIRSQVFRAASSPMDWQMRPNTKGFETLWMENSTAVSPASVKFAGYLRKADAEELAARLLPARGCSPRFRRVSTLRNFRRFRPCRKPFDAL